MSTGDLKNNIKKLQSQIKSIKFTGKLDLEGIRDGSPTAFLPLYHYVFTSYSNRLNRDISNSNNELYGKSDLRFIEAVYKILRDMFSYKPPVTREQFFQPGFAERKVIMAAEILRLVHSSYNPPSSGSSYKLASRLEKKQQDIHAKVQSSLQADPKVPSKPRKVAGKQMADLTEAIVLPRYISSSAASSLSHSHDLRDSSRPSGPTTPTRSSTDLSESDTLVSQLAHPKPSPRVSGGDEKDPVAMQFTQHITNALSMLNTQVGKISTALEKVETQIASNESPRFRQQPAQSSAVPDKLQMETLVSKVILLENRMTLLENKVEDIQAFCTILLENKNGNNNSKSPRAENSNEKDSTSSSIPITTSTSEDKVTHPNKMHPDYVNAFAPVADVGVRTITGGRSNSNDVDEERNIRITNAVDDGCDADDDVTIEDVVAKDDPCENLRYRMEAGTGDMKFMKALVGPNDSEISLSRDQDDSTISLPQQELHSNNPNSRVPNAWTTHTTTSNRKDPKTAEINNSFGNGFSPIRGHKDSSLVRYDDNSLIHIPCGQEAEDLESRRLSSTPNKADLDTSTLSRVNRIMQMMKETQEHFHQNS